MQFTGLLIYLFYRRSIEKVKVFPTTYIQTLFNIAATFYFSSLSVWFELVILTSPLLAPNSICLFNAGKIMSLLV